MADKFLQFFGNFNLINSYSERFTQNNYEYLIIDF